MRQFKEQEANTAMNKIQCNYVTKSVRKMQEKLLRSDDQIDRVNQRYLPQLSSTFLARISRLDKFPCGGEVRGKPNTGITPVTTQACFLL